MNPEIVPLAAAQIDSRVHTRSPESTAIESRLVGDAVLRLTSCGRQSLSAWLAELASCVCEACSQLGSGGAIARVVALGGCHNAPNWRILGSAQRTHGTSTPKASPVCLPAPDPTSACFGVLPQSIATSTGSAPRRALLPDPAWLSSDLQAQRARVGLGEFLRFGHTTLVHGEPMSLAIIVDQQVGQVWPEAAILSYVSVLGSLAMNAFVLLIAEPMRRQQEILEAVSPAQRQLIPLLIEGKTEREIAVALHRSPHTVHDHVKSIYASLGIASRFELLNRWYGPFPKVDSSLGSPSLPTPASARSNNAQGS